MTVKDTAFEVPLEGRRFAASLSAPRAASGLVILVHSRSSREHPRHRYMAGALGDAGIATMTLDFLQEGERRYARELFDVELHSTRLRGARRWVESQWPGRFSKFGYFASGTGAAAALQAAAAEPQGVDAIVAIAGRPDVAHFWLPLVKAPTLLIVGGADAELCAHNADACSRIDADKELCVVPGVTDVFGEARPFIVERTRDWFLTHFGATAGAKARAAGPRSAAAAPQG
jgi:putative phosphoribosyl transferase